jgi:hypothetical protein
LEYGGGGVHVHLVLRLCGERESIDAEVERRRAAERIARIDIDVVRDAGWASAYLIKTLLPEHAADRVPGRVISYSQNIEREPWRLAKRGGGSA